LKACQGRLAISEHEEFFCETYAKGQHLVLANIGRKTSILSTDIGSKASISSKNVTIKYRHLAASQHNSNSSKSHHPINTYTSNSKNNEKQRSKTP